MRITRVEAENLKGRSFAYDLSPQVAIVGENFTGKTSIIDAIRLAVIGYIPELGKLPKATRQLCSGEFMKVRLELDNGSDVTFEINGTQQHELNWKLDRSEIPLLNAAAYFGMSERERYQYVFNISKLPESITPDAVVEELEQMSFEVSPSIKATTAVVDVIHTVANHLRAVTPFQQALADTIEELKVMFTRYNGRAKDTQGAIRVLTELKNQQKTMAGNVRQLSDNETLARQASAEVYKALVDLRSRSQRAEQFVKSGERLKELRSAVAEGQEIEKLEQLINEAVASLKMNIEAKEVDVPARRIANDQAIKNFTESSAKFRERTEDRKTLDSKTECPYCGTRSKGWKDHLRAKLDEEILFFRGAVDGSARTLAEAKAELDAAEAEIKRVQEALAFNRQLNDNILIWTGQKTKRAQQRIKWNGVLEREEKELAATKVEPVAQEQLDAAYEENQKAEATYKLARQRLREAELLEQDIKRAAQSQLEHEEADAYLAVIKVVGKVLRDKQAELVDEVFGGLLKVANGIVGEILASPLAFHEGEIGRWNGHRWITHKTFSGTEQALTYVAIAAALSQGAPLRLLIFDELGRLDSERRRELIDLLIATRKAGFIDQFILVGTDDALPTDTQLAALDMQVIQL